MLSIVYKDSFYSLRALLRLPDCEVAESQYLRNRAKGKTVEQSMKSKIKPIKSELPKISVEDAKKIMSVPINPEKSRLFSYKVFK